MSRDFERPGKPARERLGTLAAEVVEETLVNQLDGLWRDLEADLWGADAKAALRESH